MPNVFVKVISNEIWGKALTVCLFCGAIFTAFSFFLSHFARAQRVIILDDLSATYVPRPEIERVNQEREKRIEEKADDIGDQLKQLRDDHKDFQHEQRALTNEILLRLPPRNE